MIEVYDAACVEVLHHEEVGVVGPVLHLNLTLSRLLHSIHKHTSKMLTLSGQYRFVGVNRLSLHNKYDICKCWIIDNRPHIHNQIRHSLIINFIFFELADIKNTNIIQPFASVEAAKDEELLGPNHTSRMPLPPSWRLLNLKWMAPAHCLCIKHIQIV